MGPPSSCSRTTRMRSRAECDMPMSSRSASRPYTKAVAAGGLARSRAKIFCPPSPGSSDPETRTDGSFANASRRPDDRRAMKAVPGVTAFVSHSPARRAAAAANLRERCWCIFARGGTPSTAMKTARSGARRCRSRPTWATHAEITRPSKSPSSWARAPLHSRAHAWITLLKSTCSSDGACACACALPPSSRISTARGQRRAKWRNN